MIEFSLGSYIGVGYFKIQNTLPNSSKIAFLITGCFLINIEVTLTYEAALKLLNRVNFY